MGILNVTPDSFSGDGLLAGRDGRPGRASAVVAAATRWSPRAPTSSTSAASPRGRATRRSTRRGERDRVVPVIAAVRAALPEHPDQRRHDQAARRRGGARRGRRPRSTTSGASAPDDALVRRRGGRARVPLVVMHNRAEPGLRATSSAEVVADLRAALERAVRLGVARDDLIVDPGFGFGKTRRAEPRRSSATSARCASLGRPILLGTSRKSTLGRVLDLPADQRLEATLATTALGIAEGADIVRVHDVARQRPGGPGERRDRPRDVARSRRRGGPA